MSAITKISLNAWCSFGARNYEKSARSHLGKFHRFYKNMVINVLLFVICLIVGSIIASTVFSEMPKKQLIVMSITTLIAFLLLSWVIVPAGATGVYHLFGKVKDKEFSSGFHFKNPLAQVTLMSIRTEEYTMSIVPEEGEKKGVDSIDALTKEGLKVQMDITVLYHLKEEKASDVYKEIGTNYVEKIIRPQIRSGIRETVAMYEAKDIYSEKREEVENKILEILKKNIESRGVVVEEVLLRNVVLPTGLTEAIENKLKAEQEAQRMDFVLMKEKKEAERKAVEAQGIRTAQETINRTLTPEYLRWYAIEMMKELANSQNTTFLFVPIDDNGMPIINLPIIK